jgi:AGCS family alanine or glycine:cation symporter
MSGLVVRITKNYFDRKNGKDVAPMLSAYDDQNAAFIADLAEENAEAEVEAEVAAAE